jgi:flagellar hook-associated protein 3 FlgL
MRITPGIISAQTIRNLQNALTALGRQQNLLSSGRRISVPSDDPGGMAQSLTVRSRRTATEQFRRNLGEARDSLQATDATLRSILETITRARELAVQGANDTASTADKQNLGAQADQLLEALVSLANSRGNRGQYLLGGQETTTVPYTVTRDSAGKITKVTVNARGIGGETPAEVSEGLTIGTTVSGNTVFGASSDTTYTFDVLMRLRDRLNANNAAQSLTFVADVGSTGSANAAKYLGITTATDLQIAGPSGTAFVGLTAAGDDTVSAVGKATSAIATAVKINAQTATTGVTATVTQAQITYTGTFANDITLDGTAGKRLVVNGVSVTGAVNGGSAAARRDALVAAINAQVSGVVAAASGTAGFTLTAADGRNISVATDATVTATSVNANYLGYTTGLTSEVVVARGGVTLTAARDFTTTAAQTPSGQIGGTGAAASVQRALDELSTTLERAMVPATTAGTRLSWLELIEDRLQDEAFVQSSNLARIEDLDLVKAVEDLKQVQNSYEAGLAASARVLRQSLLDFLR